MTLTLGGQYLPGSLDLTTAIVRRFGPFLAGDVSVVRVARGLKLVSIDGIWSSQQNENFAWMIFFIIPFIF